MELDLFPKLAENLEINGPQAIKRVILFIREKPFTLYPGLLSLPSFYEYT